MKIEEAVAIVQSVKADPNIHFMDGHTIPAEAAWRKCCEAIEARLALHREDDGELVPEGIQDIKGGYITVFRDEYNLWVIPAWHTDGRIKWRVFLPNQPTMGQLRHLIRGLGGEA